MSDADIATLGIAIDTTQVTQGTAALTALAAAAANAAKGTSSFETALARAVADMNVENTALKNNTTALGVAAGAHEGLTRNARESGSALIRIAGMMSSGVAPTQALGIEMSRLALASTGEGGLTGSLKQIGGALGALISPISLTIGAAVAMGAGIIYAASEFSTSQLEIQRSLMGIGQASGATVLDINNIAAAVSSVSDVSVSQARTAASAYASVGTIGVQTIQGLTSVTNNYARLTNTSFADATTALQKAFADPSKGAEQFAQSLGTLNYATIQNIQSLQAQGQQQQAAQILFENIAPEIQKAASNVSTLAKAWDLLKNSVSNAIDFVGQHATGGTNLGGMSFDQLTTLKGQYQNSIDRNNNSQGFLGTILGPSSATDTAFYQQQIGAIDTAIQKMGNDALQARFKTANFFTQQPQTVAAINNYDPARQEAIDLANQVDRLNALMNDPALALYRQQMGTALPLSLARATEAQKSFIDATTKAINLSNLDRQAVDTLSAAGLASIASKRTMINLSGDAGKAFTAEQKATLASNAAYAATGGIQGRIERQNEYIAALGTTASVSQQVQLTTNQLTIASMKGLPVTQQQANLLKTLAYNRALGITSMQQEIDSYKVEAATVGMTVDQAAAYTAVQNRENQARRDGQVLTAGQTVALNQYGTALGQAAARASEAKFEFQTFSGLMVDFETNLRNGESVWQAFGDAGVKALGAIADQLMKMAAQNLWTAAFGASGSSLGGLLGSWLGGLGSGGATTGAMAGYVPGGAAMSANGNVFNGPGISAYSGSIVSRPTAFSINSGPMKFAAGVGIMGEAGAEGILPLARTSSGKLGVRTTGATSPPAMNVTVAPVYTFNNADPSVEQRLRVQIAQTAQQTKIAAVAAVQAQYRNSPGNFLPSRG